MGKEPTYLLGWGLPLVTGLLFLILKYMDFGLMGAVVLLLGVVAAAAVVSAAKGLLTKASDGFLSFLWTAFTAIVLYEVVGKPVATWVIGFIGL